MHPGRDIITIGASAGGVEALRRVVGQLPADLSAAVFIVLHVWPDTRSYLAPILSRTTPLRVREPENNEAILHGVVYVAPNDQHMMVERDRILLVRGPRENRARPAINPLFRSAAAAYGPRVVGIVLTGMLDDGTAGLWTVKHCGGIAVVQEPSEALFPEMPPNAIDNVAVDHRVTLDEIAPLLVKLSRQPVDVPSVVDVPDSARAINKGVKMEPVGIDLENVGTRSVFSCPECNGALWEIAEGRQPQFRCHVGHAYSPQILATEQDLVVEQSLWSGLRALKESAALDERLASRSAELGLDKAATAHRENAAEKSRQVDHLLEFLRALGSGAVRDWSPMILQAKEPRPATRSVV